MSKYRFVCAVAAILVVLDQASKWYIRRTIALYESIPIIDSLFHITYVRNSGGAFSLFAGSSAAFRLPFFLLVSVLAIGALLYFVGRADGRQRLLLFGLGAILGGALGNLLDRLTSGEVTDFLDLHWNGYHWPAFNVADSCISVGMAILLVYSFFSEDEPGERQA